MSSFSAANKPIICATFDAGNIEVLSADSHADVRLAIKGDPPCTKADVIGETVAAKAHRQWFYFRASGVKGRACKFTIANAAEASYPDAWPGFQTVYSCVEEDALRLLLLLLLLLLLPLTNELTNSPPPLRYDRVNWNRCSSTTYSDADGLRWEHTPEKDAVFYAFFAPYVLLQLLLLLPLLLPLLRPPAPATTTNELTH
jgi:murein tripeptide amidase MpaA